MTAEYGNYGFDANGKYVPFADPMKAAFFGLGVPLDDFEQVEAAATNICEANRFLLGAICVTDEYFDEAWDMSIACIKANWPHFPDSNLPPEGSTIQERKDWAHNQISEALLIKEIYERRTAEEIEKRGESRNPHPLRRNPI